MDEKPRRVRAMFARIAPRYDLLNTLLSAGTHKWWRRTALRACRLRPGMTALDVGAGTGDMAIGMARQVGPQGRVIGVDFCEPMLARGQAKLRARGLEGSVLLTGGDAQSLPLRDTSVDAAVMAFVLRNVADVELALCEMARVVRPGGTVVVLELGRPRGVLLRAVYETYFHRILPRVAALLSHKDAYTYLPDSVAAFHSPEEVAAMMARAGLEEVRFRLLMGGVATLHVGVAGGPTGRRPGIPR